jgi:hypothetical protein
MWRFLCGNSLPLWNQLFLIIFLDCSRLSSDLLCFSARLEDYLHALGLLFNGSCGLSIIIVRMLLDELVKFRL